MSRFITRNIIGCHPLVLCILLNQQRLLIQEVIRLPDGEALVIECLMRIAILARDIDFVERTVILAPERSTPSVVQFVDIVVILCFQEIAESDKSLVVIIMIEAVITLPPALA